MCGGSTWEFDRWRPFSKLLQDFALKRDESTPTHDGQG